MLQNVATHPDSRLTCIDTFQGSDEHSLIDTSQLYETFTHNIAETGQSHRVSVIRGSSDKALRDQPYDHYDIIYIDAAHDSQNVLSDAVLAFPLLKSGGILLFDDTLDVNVNRAVTSFIECYGKSISNVYCTRQTFVIKA